MRQIKRNILRRKYGNRALKSIWRDRQIKKYGKELLAVLHKLCNPNSATILHKGRICRLVNNLNEHRRKNDSIQM